MMRKVIHLAMAVGLCLQGPAGGWTQSSTVDAPSAEAPAQTGQKISLDLKGVEILDVLKLLSQKSGLSFVAGRNVSGRVTLFVNDVEVWDVFELIVSANELAYERRGAIVTVMMARDYELLYGEKFQERSKTAVHPLTYAKVVEVVAVLNQIKSSIGRVVADEATNTLILSDTPERLLQMAGILKQLDRKTESRVYTLNYAEAEKLKEKLQELLSPGGTFTFDARTNKAIVTDSKEVLQKTDRVVSAFDVPDAQVLIEAKIVKVDLTDKMDLGVDWQQVLGGDANSRASFDVLGDVLGGVATGGALKIATLSSRSSNDRMQMIIEALKKITTTETLASPRIMVSNKHEAKILIGTKEAVVTVTTTVPATGSTVASPEIQFVDVGTKLYVTPDIKRDGMIQMKIRPEVSTSTTATPITNVSVPIVSSTEAETNVLVRSGVTLVIGGLMENKHDRTENRVPILGDLPFLGAAFRGSTDTKRKSELVVFLTPEIILPDGSKFVVPPSTDRGIFAGPDSTVILRDPVPALYRSTIRQRLQDHLKQQFRALSLGKGSVELFFVLNQQGELVGAQDIKSPEGEPFIHAAKAAIQAAQPFPPFPEGSDASEVRFRLAVEYAP